MKILLLSQIPSVYEVHRKPNQKFPDFQAQTFWIRALKELGHSIEVFRYSDSFIIPNKLSNLADRKLLETYPKLYSKIHMLKNKYYNYWPENKVRTKKLLSIIDKNHPDILLVSGGISHFEPSVLQKTKEIGCKNVLLHGESPEISATSFERQHTQLFDVIVTNDPSHPLQWEKLGSKLSVCLPYAGIDPLVHTKHKLSLAEQRRYSCQVSFVGTLFSARQKDLCYLADQGFDLKIWGYLPTKLHPKLKPYYKGEAWGIKAVKIFNASQLSINFVPDHMPIGGNMRTFEIPGSGTLQLVNRCPQEWFVPNKEIVIFSSLNQLSKKIQYYLKSPRIARKIAQAGYNRTQREHTYSQRFKKLITLVKEL